MAPPSAIVPLAFRLLLLAVMSSSLLPAARPLVIAHRGASGYLPEHTLESAAYAHALGADYIEQDVVLSKDDVLVVLHDIHLETTTDVATRFPGRQRADGRFYAIDFTWDELITLRVRERVHARTGEPVFPDRFPQNGGGFRLCTLEEQLLLIAGLNRSTGRTAGVYVEFKQPAWHTTEGKDLGPALLAVLDRHGYRRDDDPVFVQCFDAPALRRLRTEFRTELKLIQLIGEDASDEDGDYAAMTTPEGLAEIASYAQGIGPALKRIVSGADAEGQPQFTPLVAEAHRRGLAVHPYTFRADQLPAGDPSMEALLDIFVKGAGIDGFFTDHPDRALKFLSR
jgi:glycerophosphoryl diester phosphodiesterase